MNFEITEEDYRNIEAAVKAGGNIWENDVLSDFKNRVKEYFRTKLTEQCCYCRKNTQGEFKMVLDIEHILPKSKYIHLMFSLYNLSVSCKRCNMNVKRERDDFLTHLPLDEPENVDRYRIIHPNFDNYYSHLEYFTETVNELKIIKYRVVDGSSKGQFTYDYFKLKELEINLLDNAQGGRVKEEISTKVPDDFAKRIEDLLRHQK